MIPGLRPDVAREMVRSCCLIKQDAANDAANLDGQIMSGMVVGTNFGQLYAMVASLAGMVEALAAVVMDDA